MKNKAFLVFSAIIALLSIMGNLSQVSARALATPTVTPTIKPASKYGEFNINKVNKIPPADIIRQISFNGTGGGEACRLKNYTYPELESKQNMSEELMVKVEMDTCGWTKNEKLTGSVQYPGGEQRTLPVDFFLNGTGIYAGVIYFKPGINDPTGKYIFTISGKSGVFQQVVNFYTPRSPTIYTLDDYHLLLYNFLPNEKIRLFFYDVELKGWQEYTVGSDGRIEIKTSMNIRKGHFIAVGEKTGEVRTKERSGIIEKTILLGKKHCEGGLPSRIKVGDYVRAAFTDGSDLRIRTEPGFNQIIESKVPEGTKMKIVNGPKCAGGCTWWKVEVSGNIKGWVAEYWNGNEYLIEPIP